MKPSNVRIVFSLDKKLHAALCALSERECRSLTQQVTLIVRNHLDSVQPQHNTPVIRRTHVPDSVLDDLPDDM
jgi:hypothetical protein